MQETKPMGMYTAKLHLQLNTVLKAPKTNIAAFSRNSICQCEYNNLTLQKQLDMANLKNVIFNL